MTVAVPLELVIAVAADKLPYEVVKVTVAPAIGPFDASNTVAFKLVVEPPDLMVAILGDTVIDATAGGLGIYAGVLTSVPVNVTPEELMVAILPILSSAES